MFGKLGDLDTYVHAGRPEEAQRVLQELRSRLSPPLDLLTAVGELDVAVATEDSAGIEEGIAGVERAIEGFGFEALRPLILRGRGKLLEQRGECERAIAIYERILALEPADPSPHTDIGRCYRELGRGREAEDELREVLSRHPFDPRAHVELARVMAASGRTRTAIAHLDSALGVWAEASPEFEPAQEARRERAELTNAPGTTY